MAAPQGHPPNHNPSEGWTRSTDYYHETGDLEILSSDNVLFKVQAYYLQASS